MTTLITAAKDTKCADTVVFFFQAFPFPSLHSFGFNSGPFLNGRKMSSLSCHGSACYSNYATQVKEQERESFVCIFVKPKGATLKKLV